MKRFKYYLVFSLLAGLALAATFVSELSANGDSGSLEIYNDTGRGSAIYPAEPKDIYVFIARLDLSRTVNCGYWAINAVLSPGQSKTYRVSGSEELLIRAGYSPNACDWRWQFFLNPGQRERRALRF